MSSGLTKTGARDADRGVDHDRAAPPELTAQEIAVFCNLLGLAPRHLAKGIEAITSRYDLGPRGAWMIGLIEIGVSSPTALTDAFCIGRSLVTAEINRLLHAGLVTTSQSPEDGRRTILALTPQGRKVSARLRATVNAFVSQRLAGHSREEVLAAIALLRSFVAGASIGTPR